MNKEQRRYLVDNVTSTYNAKKEELEDTIPEEPLLNNYIIGAFLDNSVKILDEKTIKANLKKVVEALGSEDFVESESMYRRRSGRSAKDEGEWQYIKIDPEDILEMPESYKIARAEWEKKKAEVDNQIKALTAQKDSLVLRINIGSNAILDKLITQVDSLGDLDLFSNKLSLIAEGIEKPVK